MLSKIQLMSIRTTRFEEPSQDPQTTAGSSPSSMPHAGLGGLVPRRNSSEGLPLGRHDRRLASYLLGRYAVGRPVDPQEFDQLKRCNSSLKESRDLLHRGRGNVAPDVEQSDGRTFYTNEAVRTTLRAQDRVAELTVSEAAGAAAFHHVGNCQEHANVALHTHAARLADGERVELTKDPLGDHGVVVHTGHDGTQVVIDPWSDGSVVNAKDGVYTDGSRELVVVDSAQAEDATRRIAEFRRGYQGVGPALAPAVEETRARLEHERAKPRVEPRPPESTVSEAFAARAAQKLSKGPEAILRRDGNVFQKAGSKLAGKSKADERVQAERWADVLNRTFAHAGASEFANAVGKEPIAIMDIVEGAKALGTTAPARGGSLDAP